MDPAIIYLFVVFLLLAVITDILPFIKTARNIGSLSQNSLRTIQSADLNDDQKQSVLLKNSAGIFKESSRIIFFTSVLVGVLLLLLWLSHLIKPLNYNYLMDYLVSTPGIILSIISFLSYFAIKKLYGKFRV